MDSIPIVIIIVGFIACVFVIAAFLHDLFCFSHKTVPFKLKDGNVFACDVDDTLVMWDMPDDWDGPVVEIITDGFPEKAAVNTYAVSLPKILLLWKQPVSMFA